MGVRMGGVLGPELQQLKVSGEGAGGGGGGAAGRGGSRFGKGNRKGR